MSKTQTLTLTIPCLSPENYAICEALLDAAMLKIPEIVYLTSSTSKDTIDNNVDKHLDIYFIAGTIAEYDHMDGEWSNTNVHTTLSFTKGSFSLTEAIALVNKEFKNTNFFPTCISKL